ncbi:MAG: amidohydrolase family protein [Nitrospirae bacterium]|nr:amidohydrolase family protein [Nitrospirota bacterium]
MRKSKVLLSFILILCLASCAKRATLVRYSDSEGGLTVVRNVRVFPATGADALPGHDVWVVNGVIEVVLPTGRTPPPVGAQIVDGTGKTLLPGLIDVHVHVEGSPRPAWDMGLPNPRTNVRQLLYAGVTTAFDLGGPLKLLGKLRADIEKGSLPGPDLYYSGPHVAIKNGHPAAMVSMIVPGPFDRMVRPHVSFEVESEKDIDAALAEIRKLGGYLVKVTEDEIPLGAPMLPPALLAHAVRQAHEMGFKVAAHIGSNANALAAVDAGVDMLVHNVYREVLMPDTAERIRQAGVAVAPTIGVFHSIDLLAYEGPDTWPLMIQMVEPEVLEALRNRPKEWELKEIRPWLAAVHANREQRFRNAAMLREHGVTLLVGSDSANMGWPAGAAIHREMDYLVRAGYTPSEVLTAATRNNARAMGLTDRGTIEPGKRADLLLVEGDPTQDIEAVHRIAAVLAAGREIARGVPSPRP